MEWDRSSQPLENSVGLKSFTLVFANEEVRQEAINDLRDIGATVTKENNNFSTHDPSGNSIELSI